MIPGALTAQQVTALHTDLLEIAHAQNKDGLKSRNVYIYKRMFEKSQAHLDLFFNEPIATLAEFIIGDGHDEGVDPFTSTALQTHVIHNNCLITPPKKSGVNIWHQDDQPHYLVKEGPTPQNVHLPVLAFTVNYYLNDCKNHDNGPTRVVPGSHLFGKPCPNNPESHYKVRYCCGSAGTAVLFNNQVWHAGCPNKSDQYRYVSQVTYARRLVGHKYYPFMNYEMPEHVINRVTGMGKREKRMLGFLDHGAWG